MQGHVSRHKAIKEALLDYLLEIAGQHGVTLDKTQKIKIFKGWKNGWFWFVWSGF
jgi:hypothetical protein